MSPLSINQAIDRLDELHGLDITIYGILSFEFEDCCIEHYPKAERRLAVGNRDGFTNSSIWLEVGTGSLGFNVPTLKKWHGKRVVIEGTLYGPGPMFDGCGHLSRWPAAILARTIERHNS